VELTLATQHPFRSLQQFYQTINVMFLGEEAVDVHTHRATAVQDRGR
jgi:hypothetical protein